MLGMGFGLGGVERAEVEQRGVVRVDERAEGHAAAPAVVEVLHLDPAAHGLARQHLRRVEGLELGLGAAALRHLG